MAKPTTNSTQRVRVQVCLPPDVYDVFKERADQQLQPLSSFGAALIKNALQATTTEACVNSTQASA